MQLPLRAAFNVHKQPVQSYFRTGTYGAARRWAFGDASETVTISATIMPITDNIIKIAPQGINTDGSLVMQTDFPVYIVGTSNTATESRQTFIIYQGEHWRAWAINSVADKNGGISRYILTKYIDE